jgi:tumor protein p53-inducible protein 3
LKFFYLNFIGYFIFQKGGGNAEYVAVNEKHIIKVPSWMSLKHASAIPEVWLTAFQLLYWVSSVTNSEQIKDKTFLVHAGAR